MRIAAAIFIMLHGLGHVVWFLATWEQKWLGKSGRADMAKHEERFIVNALSPMGKIVGLLAIIGMGGFVTTGIGVWTEVAWWPAVLIGSAVVSMFVLVSMWNPVMTVSIRALLANIGLTAATLMPWGDRILGAH